MLCGWKVSTSACCKLPVKGQFFSSHKYLKQIWIPNYERALNFLEHKPALESGSHLKTKGPLFALFTFCKHEKIINQ